VFSVQVSVITVFPETRDLKPFEWNFLLDTNYINIPGGHNLKKYETIVIIDEKAVKDDGTAFLADFEKVIKKDFGGVIVESEIWGRKQFAREIKRKKTGIYLDVVHELDADKILPLRDKYKLNETVLRLQTYCYDRPEK
jgi:ribosomal protein S6